MAVNNILFPSCNWQTRFSGGQDMGWNAINPNIGLDGMAQAIVDNGDGENASHAIPSPIAHLKDFKKRLDANDQRALNEWRGMLAVIALRKARGFAVSVRDISLDQTNLGRVFFDTLVDNADVTGYEDGENVKAQKMLTVFFMKNQQGQDKAFAMFMPSIGICPFKAYPADIFKNVPWYDAENGRWNDLKSTIEDANGDLTVEEANLANWTSNFQNNRAYKDYFSKFAGYIDPNGDAAQIVNGNNDGADNFKIQAWDAWKKYCPIPDYIPCRQFSDKLLLVLAPKDEKNYSAIPKKGNGFVPNQVVGGSNNNGSYCIYAIPPISEEVVKCLCNHSDKVSLKDDTWFIEAIKDEKGNYTGFKVAFCLSAENNAEFKYEKEFGKKDVAFAVGMPYISMWPDSKFDNGNWSDYLISIFTDPNNKTEFLTDVKNASLTGDISKIRDAAGTQIEAATQSQDGETKFKISVIASGDDNPQEYKCEPNSITANEEKVRFWMTKSTTKPFALTFKYNSTNPYTLGAWVISSVPTNAMNNENNSAIVAMDFGTTSTNVYISDILQDGQKASSESICSPGEYVEDIYQPCKEKRKIYQNYYLFSAEGGKLNKIFTFGQNYEPKGRSDNGKLAPLDTGSMNGYKHNIFGRFIKADLQYIHQGNNANNKIYSKLKWQDGDNQDEKNKARNNFISTLLTSAVLEAVKKGAGRVELRVSYPSSNLNEGIKDTIDSIEEKIRSDSGISIDCKYATEARSAGEYFKERRGVNIVPTSGYAVMDIGGGTTDVSFWKQEGYQNTNLELKSEYSFKYAGSDIVEKTIIKYYEKREDRGFDQLWQKNGTADVQEAVNRYVGFDANRADYEDKKSEIINFLMEYNYDQALGQGPMKNIPADLKSAMILKYCSLFYLVAAYLECKQVNYDSGRFALCLAGCGSKSINLFDGCQGKCKAILRNKLELSAEPNLCLPTCADKSEVVRGLVMLNDGDGLSKDIAQNDGKMDNPETVPKEKVHDAYKQLIDSLNSCYHNGTTDGLLKKIGEDLRKDNESKWNLVIPNAIQKAVKTHCDSDIIAELCAVYLLDEVINQLL